MMTDPRREDAVDGDRAEEKAEVASAALLIQGLVKAARGFSIYLPNNPLHEKFFTDFCQRAGEHLEEFGPLQLDLTHNSLLCRGETIYTTAELRENIAFRMYADGIRTMVIGEGVEPLELRSLVDILGSPGSESDEDDIVTRLWSADLPHVKYVLAEDPPESTVAAFGLTSVKATQEGALRRYAVELAAMPPEPPPPPPPQQVFTLAEEEVAALQALLAREEQTTPFQDMANILEAILGAEEDAAILDEFLEILARLCGDLMLTERIDQALTLLALLSRVAARPGLRPDHATRIDGVRARVLTADVVAGLSRLLARSDGMDRDLLRRIVAALGRAAVEPFCRILGEVPGKDMRKVLIEALAEAGRGAPELFLPSLQDSRWYLVRNAIYILRRIGGPEAAGAVFRCATHKDPRVRKEVVFYFEETGEPGGESAMLGLLGDSVQSLRIAAARSLARRGSRAAADRLLALTVSPGFAERERLEREAVWEALGALSPEAVFPTFKDMILKRHWFGAAKEFDDTACACAGLKRIGTPQAIEVLRQAASAKRGEARDLVEKALRSLAHGRVPDERAAGEGGGEAGHD